MDNRAQASLFGSAAAQVASGTQCRSLVSDEAQQDLRDAAGGCESAVGARESRGGGGVAVIRFTVPGEPVGKGRPRAFRIGNSVRMHTPDKTARYENLVAMAAQQAMSGIALVDGAVEIELLLVTVPPASWSKKKRAAALAAEIRPTTKPDCDNVFKAIADACNGIVWVDDKQITDVVIRKRYGETPFANVLVREPS